MKIIQRFCYLFIFIDYLSINWSLSNAGGWYERELTGCLCCRSVWEHHVEEGFGSGPAGVSCWLSVLRQPGAARADSAVHQPAKHPVAISEQPEQPEERGAVDLRCLGRSDHSADSAVEQSGGRVSQRAELCQIGTHVFLSPGVALLHTVVCRDAAVSSVSVKECVIMSLSRLSRLCQSALSYCLYVAFSLHAALEEPTSWIRGGRPWLAGP